MKHILVTGTKGYLGSSFQQYIERYNENLPEESRWQVTSVSMRDDSWREIDLSQFDAILHVAGIVHRKEQPDMESLYQEVNTDLTLELAKAYYASRRDKNLMAHFVFMSTMSVYGIVKGHITKDTPTNPKNFYGKSKLAAEQGLLALQQEANSNGKQFILSIVRPPMIYGYQCSGNYASLEKLARKVPLFPKVKNKRSMLYVDNLSELLRLVMEKGQDGLFLPQNADYVNTSALVREIAKDYGKKSHLVPGFAWLIKIFVSKVSVFAKVFGSLTYDKELSIYPALGNYQFVDFAESVKCSSTGASAGLPLPEGHETKITVLMSLYYKEKPEYFRTAMDSIMDQTYKADEIVLIEDGPLTEELYDAVAEYAVLCSGANSDRYPNLVIHSFSENQQLGRALAKGVELASNEIIARMDTDDVAVLDRLEKQLAYLNAHPELAVVGGAIHEFNDEGTVSRVKSMPRTMGEVRQYMKNRNPLNHMTVMYRRSAILAAGNYQHFPFLEDYSLWSRMVSMGYKIGNMEDILVNARTSMGLVKRRSGWAYYKGFRKLRKMQHKLGLTSTGEYIKTQIGTFGMIMMPGWFKELAYKTVLRKS